MRILSIFLLSAAAVCAQAASSGPKLFPGAKAPKIEVSSWAKYSPVPKSGKLLVVEFWATWCGPCRQSIPHLTELAKKYKDKADFVGVSVFERADSFAQITDKVAKFVAEMGDKMDYRVAIDTEDGKMAKNWLEASEQDGIPVAFIVDSKGIVEWIGHPMGLDEPLQQAIEGKLDVAKQKKDYLEASKKGRKVREVRTRFGQAVKLYKEGKKSQAEKTLQPLDKQGGDLAEACNYVRLNDMYTPGTPESEALIAKMIKGSVSDQAFLATYAYINATREGGNKDVAAKVASLVYEKSSVARAMQYVALTAKKLGNLELMSKAVEKGLKSIESGVDKENYPETKEVLNQLKKEITAK